MQDCLFHSHSPLISQETCGFSSYGVDWSDSAESTSHCWLPYSFNNSSTSHSCVYTSCKNSKSTSDSPLIQCAACLLTVHTVHLFESQETTTHARQLFPPCRPSFTHSSRTNDLSRHDQHYWAFVPTLSSSCTHCKQKSLKRTLDDNSKRARDKPTVGDSATIGVAGSATSKLNDPSRGLVCLWCSRSYHQRCWKNIKDDEEISKCDYGKFG